MVIYCCKFLFMLLYFFFKPWFGQPTGEGGATRAPICIDLKKDSSLSSKSVILQIDSKSQQVSASEAFSQAAISSVHIMYSSLWIYFQ